MPNPSDIALISLATTPGLRRADAAFKAAADAAGVSCEVIPVQVGAAGKLRRQMTVTDFVEAAAARQAARAANARVVVFSTVTAALLEQPRGPYAIRFDSPAALNRPGAAGALQRMRERRLMEGAQVLLPWGDAAKEALPPALAAKAIPLHVPIGPPGKGVTPGQTGDSPSDGAGRDLDVLAYAGYPEKRGLDLLIRAWNQISPDARLVVAGIERERAEEWLRTREVPVPRSVEWRGLMERDEWEATLARTRIFVNASRREDHGLSQLEALAAGAMLVTVPSIGPYEALPIARRLEPSFVGMGIGQEALAFALRTALGAEPGDYAERAARELEPYSAERVQATFEEQVLPALGLR